jgi:hypothetical protein
MHTALSGTRNRINEALMFGGFLLLGTGSGREVIGGLEGDGG